MGKAVRRGQPRGHTPPCHRPPNVNGRPPIKLDILAVASGTGDPVLVAVELVLESGNPSAEHVENVLNRLKAAPPPDHVETCLKVSEAPIADTGRYDQLRGEVRHA